MEIIRGYLGTYASERSRGIYQFTFDPKTGMLTAPRLYYQVPDCKYLSLQGGLLAAPVKREKGSGLCLLHTDADDGSAAESGADHFFRPAQCEEILTEPSPSCYVVQDDSFVYTANYHEGTVQVYSKAAGIPTLLRVIENGQKAGCHQVMLHGRYLLVPCLLQDRVCIFDREKEFAPAGELMFPRGTGPRHGIFDRAHKRLFLVSELSNQIFVYRVAGAKFSLCSTVEILKGQKTGAAAPASAAIRLSKDESTLYVSTRFTDVLTVFRVEKTSLTMIQQAGSGGAGPRDFILTDGGYLLAVNRKEGGLVSFRLDPEDGSIEALCCRVPAVEAVSIVLEATAV